VCVCARACREVMSLIRRRRTRSGGAKRVLWSLPRSTRVFRGESASCARVCFMFCVRACACNEFDQKKKEQERMLSEGALLVSAAVNIFCARYL
jgi:hypothetical protein